MLFLMVAIIFSNVACITNKNAGTILFDSTKAKLNCWNQDDIAKLRARKTFEELIPPQVSPERINKKFIKHTLGYFENALENVHKDVDFKTAIILKEALSDAIGAHLKSEILPTVRFAYYAGYVPYRHARQIHNFYERIKEDLNTQGLGWKQPARIPQWSNLTVAKILIGSGKFLDPCTCLVTKRDTNNCIHLPSPKLDDKQHPSAISLPFKSNGLVSLLAPNSEDILLKYYTTASRCILNSSPENCRHADFVNFNNELWHWMKRDVAPHLVDEKLYTAYGGVLRIAAAVQNYGKGLSRRNLFDYQDPGVSKWNPWKTLTQSYVNFNSDWSPKLYILLVLLAASAIWVMQICYNYLFGDPNACSCKDRTRKTSFSKEVAYTEVDSNFPAVLPQQNAVYYTDKTRPPSRTKTPSMGSIRTQKVYDLNENTEKLMAIIMSDNKDSVTGSSPSKLDSEDESEDKRTTDSTKDSRPRSPPKIETSVAHLTLEKAQPIEKRATLPMYSTSTITHSETTYCPDRVLSETGWSGTSTSTSGKTASSTSSKSRSRRSRSSRDLTWARRVISRHSRRGGPIPSTTGTEEASSFLTPPSHR